MAGSKYRKTVPFWDEMGTRRNVPIDVYQVLVAFGVTCPATGHAVKKLLMAGKRGHKDRVTDLQEAAEAVGRAVELATDELPG